MTTLERLFVALDEAVDDEDLEISKHGVEDLRLRVKDALFPNWQTNI